MNKRNRVVLSFAMALLLVASVPGSSLCGVIIDWGNECYGVEPNYSGHYSTAGNELKIFGKIHTFNAPFGDLDPNVQEYTFIFDNLISQGTNDFGGAGIWMTDYSGGAFRVFCDSTPDFDFANQATFGDGELILQGTFSVFTSTVIDGSPPSGSANYDFAFTGGTLYDRVSGCVGAGIGFWGDGLFPGVNIPSGYDVHLDGKFDLGDCPPTGVEEGSWGELKTLFR